MYLSKQYAIEHHHLASSPASKYKRQNWRGIGLLNWQN